MPLHLEEQELVDGSLHRARETKQAQRVTRRSSVEYHCLIIHILDLHTYYSVLKYTEKNRPYHFHQFAECHGLIDTRDRFHQIFHNRSKSAFHGAKHVLASRRGHAFYLIELMGTRIYFHAIQIVKTIDQLRRVIKFLAKSIAVFKIILQSQKLIWFIITLNCEQDQWKQSTHSVSPSPIELKCNTMLWFSPLHLYHQRISISGIADQ
jgi:hypothetical protein